MGTELEGVEGTISLVSTQTSAALGKCLWYPNNSSFLKNFYLCLFSCYRVSFCCPGWSAVVQSQLTAASAFWAQAILSPQPPE